MKILVCPDKFKDALSAKKVGEAIAIGLTKAEPDLEILQISLSDGGDGFLHALEMNNSNLKRNPGPLAADAIIEADFGLVISLGLGYSNPGFFGRRSLGKFYRKEQTEDFRGFHK